MCVAQLYLPSKLCVGICNSKSIPFKEIRAVKLWAFALHGIHETADDVSADVIIFLIRFQSPIFPNPFSHRPIKRGEGWRSWGQALQYYLIASIAIAIHSFSYTVSFTSRRFLVLYFHVSKISITSRTPVPMHVCRCRSLVLCIAHPFFSIFLDKLEKHSGNGSACRIRPDRVRTGILNPEWSTVLISHRVSWLMNGRDWLIAANYL